MKHIFDLSGKRALITGSTSGLGMAMAQALGNAGAALIVHGNTPRKMEVALDIYRKAGFDVHSRTFDVTNEPSVEESIEGIETEIGPIDIVVNNAGIIQRTPAADMAIGDFRRIIDVDLVAPFIVARSVGKRMIARKRGKIINICSMMSELGRDTVTAYASAKGGLKMLTKSLATEWARHNIQVNGIGPGYFATEQTAPIRRAGHPFHDFIINRTPAGRWGDPEDLAGTVIFLASNASNFVNGQVIYVDGGILATIGKPMNEN